MFLKPDCETKFCLVRCTRLLDFQLFPRVFNYENLSFRKLFRNVFANLAFKTITFFKIYIKIFDVKQNGMKMEKFWYKKNWCEKSNNFGVK